jgi:hypothetical protein
VRTKLPPLYGAPSRLENLKFILGERTSFDAAAAARLLEPLD